MLQPSSPFLSPVPISHCDISSSADSACLSSNPSARMVVGCNRLSGDASSVNSVNGTTHTTSSTTNPTLSSMTPSSLTLVSLVNKYVGKTSQPGVDSKDNGDNIPTGNSRKTSLNATNSAIKNSTVSFPLPEIASVVSLTDALAS
ncbi:unnamed protein product [Protopolystoma xenopodis]|uniref:Uncharacterized protein n=1 Tax=Protopolystoma xenopodis TaxID=117903 RepID=A0A3S4ZYT9_9PLAT|nr:unnamed protein product [Protopolystoma xenopodis]